MSYEADPERRAEVDEVVAALVQVAGPGAAALGQLAQQAIDHARRGQDFVNAVEQTIPSEEAVLDVYSQRAAAEVVAELSKTMPDLPEEAVALVSGSAQAAAVLGIGYLVEELSVHLALAGLLD